MPRQARLDVPGALHHIMVRGINKSSIFKDDQDKNLFLERLGQNVIEGKCSVYAWVITENHVHLLFKSGPQGISVAMRKLLTGYALERKAPETPTIGLSQKAWPWAKGLSSPAVG